MLEDVQRLDDRVGKLQKHFNAVTSDINQITTSTGKITNRGETILEVEMRDDDRVSTEVAAPPRVVSSGGG